MPLSLHTGTRRWQPGADGIDPTLADIVERTNKEHDVRIALAAMIFGGVFERYPRLKVGAVEFEVAWAPYFLARMDNLYTEQALGVHGRRFAGDALPSDFFRRNCFLSFQEDALGIAAPCAPRRRHAAVGLGLPACRIHLSPVPRHCGAHPAGGARGRAGADRGGQHRAALSLRLGHTGAWTGAWCWGRPRRPRCPERSAPRMRRSQRRTPWAWVLACLVVGALLAGPLHDGRGRVARRQQEGRPQVLAQPADRHDSPPGGGAVQATRRGAHPGLLRRPDLSRAATRRPARPGRADDARHHRGDPAAGRHPVALRVRRSCSWISRFCGPSRRR